MARRNDWGQPRISAEVEFLAPFGPAPTRIAAVQNCGHFAVQPRFAEHGAFHRRASLSCEFLASWQITFDGIHLLLSSLRGSQGQLPRIRLILENGRSLWAARAVVGIAVANGEGHSNPPGANTVNQNCSKKDQCPNGHRRNRLHADLATSSGACRRPFLPSDGADRWELLCCNRLLRQQQTGTLIEIAPARS